jgi:archaellum component FlaF (FlaF/FlaG flagellin family)
MSIEQIRDDVHSETITFGPHLVERMYENGISIDQVLNVILNGTVVKKEPDERSGGKFTKYTLRRGHITITVKDCRPAFIITASRS